MVDPGFLETMRQGQTGHSFTHDHDLEWLVFHSTGYE
jgi:hypothetical protein